MAQTLANLKVVKLEYWLVVSMAAMLGMKLDSMWVELMAA